MVAGERAPDRVGGPVILALTEEPALHAGIAFVGQALMLEQLVGLGRRAMAGEVGRACRNMKSLWRHHAALHARVVQGANPKQQVGACHERVDITVGLLDIQLQLGMASMQFGDPRRQVQVTEYHRCVDANQAAGFALLFLQGLFRFLCLHQHQSRMMGQQASCFSRGDRPGVAIDQLLTERLFHQLDLSRDRRRREPFATGHLGKTAVIQHCDEQAQCLETQLIETLHGPSYCAIYAKELSVESHFSQNSTSRYLPPFF